MNLNFEPPPACNHLCDQVLTKLFILQTWQALAMSTPIGISREHAGQLLMSLRRKKQSPSTLFYFWKTYEPQFWYYKQEQKQEQRTDHPTGKYAFSLLARINKTVLFFGFSRKSQSYRCLLGLAKVISNRTKSSCYNLQATESAGEES